MMNDDSTTKILEGLTSPSKAIVRVGLILLSTDEVGGKAFTSIMPASDTLVFTTRTAYEHSDGFAVATSYRELADTLPPTGRFDVLAFSCTSGTIALGVDTLLAELALARPGVRYTSPAIAAVSALRQLSAKRIVVMTPYPVAFHKSSILPFFRGHEFDVVADGTFDKHSDAEIGELRADCILGGARMLVETASPDALFVSCTATPVVPLIAQLEKELGIPVVTSTQAMAWDALRLAGYLRPIDGFGRLLTLNRELTVR
ncbi:maleate cis-trans isomerase family protein [Bradyrhizobium sp. CCBAU 21362]|uniref:maleate cis-trans isomerase family protein n=1 Tax=Bradyrhizobium sp. CCBAU 21362 TaxID=1325082 RepID=UPI002306B309|nr:hypothetical protein [Bradyrhizobium sp. CCBAU 21362]